MGQSSITAPPHLRRVAFAGGLYTAAWQMVPGIAVSARGRIAVTADIAAAPHEGTVLQILSPSSDTLISVARKGQGPGEMSGADAPFAVADTFHVFDLQRRVDVVYTDNGRFLREDHPQATQQDYIIGFVADSVDTQALPTDLHSVPSLPSRRKIGETQGRLLLPVVDSFLQRMLRPVPTGGLLAGPRYALSASSTAVGDPDHYEIAVFTTSGNLQYMIHRSLAPLRRSADENAALRKSLSTVSGPPGAPAPRPPQARLDTLDREHLPFFAQTGLQFDGAGRLWVIGQQGDSTFADVFSKASFLGRQMLPCARPGRRIALQGKWLALDCEAPGHDSPYQIQLYEIQ